MLNLMLISLAYIQSHHIKNVKGCVSFLIMSHFVMLETITGSIGCKAGELPVHHLAITKDDVGTPAHLAACLCIIGGKPCKTERKHPE